MIRECFFFFFGIVSVFVTCLLHTNESSHFHKVANNKPNNSTEQSFSLEAHTVPQVVKKKFSRFRKPEGSLPRSQQPDTFAYPEPHQSSSHPPYYNLQIRFNIILSYMAKLSQTSLSFRFLHQNPARNSILPTCPTCTAWEKGLHLDYETALDIHYDIIIIITKNLQINCS